MTENNPEVTQPVSEKKKKKDKKKFFQRRSSWYLIAILMGLLIVLTGSALGIPSAINDRLALAEAQAARRLIHSLNWPVRISRKAAMKLRKLVSIGFWTKCPNISPKMRVRRWLNFILRLCSCWMFPVQLQPNQPRLQMCPR